MTRSLAVLAIGALCVVASPVAVAAADSAPVGGQSIAGAYLGLLDLTPLGFGPRIETVYIVLDNSGAAVFTSEHEEDKESAGVGVWQQISHGTIGLGVASFRYGPDIATSICALVGVDSPPGNCVLKVAGTVARAEGGGLEGALLLSVEDLDATVVVTIPAWLPLSMEKLTLGDFVLELP
jgi:hypothetical protein